MPPSKVESSAQLRLAARGFSSRSCHPWLRTPFRGLLLRRSCVRKIQERMTATILKDNVKDVLTRHSGPHRMPFADYLSSSVTLVCDSHADFDRLFGLPQMHTCHCRKF